MLECFSHTVRRGELDASIYKREGLHHARVTRARKDRQPRPTRPRLWITSTGRPREVLRAYEAEPLDGWPRGFWTLRRWDGLHVVVLSELPRDPDTLTLRLLGRAATLRHALMECAALPPGSPLERLLGPFLVAFKPHILQDRELHEESNMNVLEQVHAMYDRWEREVIDRGRQEGRQEGEVRGLLRLLARRFGELPGTVTARVTRARIEDIERWFDRAVDAATLDDVFAE